MQENEEKIKQIIEELEGALNLLFSIKIPMVITGNSSDARRNKVEFIWHCVYLLENSLERILALCPGDLAERVRHIALEEELQSLLSCHARDESSIYNMRLSLRTLSVLVVPSPEEMVAQARTIAEELGILENMIQQIIKRVVKMLEDLRKSIENQES